jgi:alkylation response protein AidB-like acyl-CoA dehydrogenase
MAMKIDLGPQYETFRGEIVEWIDGNLPTELSLGDNAGWAQVAGGRRMMRAGAAMRGPAYHQWVDRLGEDRYICALWPQEFGGRGWDAVQFAIFAEELRKRGAPLVRRGMGETLCGPAIIHHGTDAQRAHFLPRIVDGTDVYCQGYSEPNYGSDLGGVETKGVVDGDEVVITGQKIWTSGAKSANMMFVICRTDSDAPKHRGLSYVLVPFSEENGITIRAVRQMTGAAEFCEDFLDGARAPLFNVIGGLNNGWGPAMTTLGFERGGNATTAHLGYEQELEDLIDVARSNGRAQDPVIRQRFAWCFTQVELMRYAGLRTLASLVEGRQPGPEASINKLFWSEYHKVFGELAVDVIGPAAMVRPGDDDYETTDWQDLFLASRAGTIYSGTSQIQKNIIGERALGLPKEPVVQGGK